MTAAEPSAYRPADAHAWLLFSMWRRPRLVSGFVIVTALLLLGRMACAPFDPVPGAARFLPPALPGTVAAVLLGPVAPWAAAAASLLADFIAGTWSPVSWFRAAGEFAAALHVFALWDSSFRRRQPALVLAPAWRQAVRFVALAVPAGFIAAAWNGLGVELFGSHAFGYVAALEALQVAVFGLLLAPALFFGAAGDIAMHLGDWRPVAEQEDRWSHWRPAGLVAACVTATAILPAALLACPGIAGGPAWAASHLGQSTGGGLPELLAGGLAFHLIVLLWPDGPGRVTARKPT